MSGQGQDSIPRSEAGDDSSAGPREAAPKPRIGVLVSGGGRSLENLAEHIAAGELEAELALVISSKASAYALERAARLGLESRVHRASNHATPEAFSRAVFADIEGARCDLVVLAGWLKFLPIPRSWLGRVINIHPSLLPAFGGKGFYGDRVHRAALERGVQFSGCTVHGVDNEYDHGPILLQRVVEVRADDTVETLGARVFEAECKALPDAIRMVLGARASSAPPRG